MSAAGRFWLGYAVALALALALLAMLAGCSTTGRTYSVPPYVGADCMTTSGQAVRVTGAMPGGWFWIKGEPSAPWMVPASHLQGCI